MNSLLLVALAWTLVSVVVAFETGWFLRRVRRLAHRGPRDQAVVGGSGSRT